MQVYHWMQHEATGMTIGAAGFANEFALFVDQREKFFHEFKSKKKSGIGGIGAKDSGLF